MSESMDALDKMVLGEAIGEMVTAGPEEAVAAKVEKVDVEGAHEGTHEVDETLLVANASAATEKMELDEKTKDTPEDKVKTTPKKRAAEVTNDGSQTPKKKRTPAKAKNAKNGDADIVEGTEPITPKKATKAKKVKTEAADGEDATNDSKEAAEPTTPKKKRTPAKPKNSTPKVATDTNDNAEAGAEDESTTTPKARASPSKAKANGDGTPRKRQPPASGVAPSRGIPTSWEDATGADKLLVRMKDEGSDWNAIRAAWKDVTGNDTASSTLPNRYNRIKVNMMRLKDGDDKILLAAKEEVEHKFQNEKWALVATEMEAKGANKYPTLFIQKKFKELSAMNLDDGAVTVNATTATEGSGEEEDDVKAEE